MSLRTEIPICWEKQNIIDNHIVEFRRGSTRSTTSAITERATTIIMGPHFVALLEPGATSVLHNPAKGHVLANSGTGITVFLDEKAAKRTDCRQYHWHCILKDDCLVFRNAFSGSTLRPSYNSNADGQALTTKVDDSTSDAVFCVLDDLNCSFIIYHNLQGGLHSISMAYNDRSDIFYPILLNEPKEDAVVHWRFEWVQNNGYEVNYGPNDYELRDSSLSVSDSTSLSD